MAYVWQRWLEDELREALEARGHRLIVVDGWENRGRPASTGHFDPNGAHTKHHTGAFSSRSDPAPTLRTLIAGRPDLPGPLCQVASAHNGDVYLIAAGRANHAGRVGKSGVVGMPLGADGNALALGDEVETNGTQDLPPAQVEAMDIVSAVILKHFGRPVEWLHRHADISGTGKWDIGNRTTPECRAGAADALNHLEDDMPFTEKELRNIIREETRAAVDDVLEVEMNAHEPKGDPAFRGRSLRNVIKAIAKKVGAV